MGRAEVKPGPNMVSGLGAAQPCSGRSVRGHPGRARRRRKVPLTFVDDSNFLAYRVPCLVGAGRGSHGFAVVPGTIINWGQAWCRACARPNETPDAHSDALHDRRRCVGVRYVQEEQVESGADSSDRRATESGTTDSRAGNLSSNACRARSGCLGCAQAQEIIPHLPCARRTLRARCNVVIADSDLQSDPLAGRVRQRRRGE